MQMNTAQLLVPDVVFDGHGKQRPGPLLIEQGRIAAVGKTALEQRDRATVIDLKGKLVVPGFTNAHSHAFQRALRGHVERRSTAQPEDDFWSWRSLMYACAQKASEQDRKSEKMQLNNMKRD